jgi:hypothetical protein
MKRVGKIAICLAGGLALCAGARAAGALPAGNPYEAIILRNVFGLNPPPTNAPTNPEDALLPKITPNGIMSIFGQLQVLFKVAPKPGVKDAKEESYVLSEGQAQDEIEVVRIDEKAASVTFNNHGTVQELPLANAPKLNLPVSGGGGGGPGGGGSPHFTGPRGGGPGGGGGPASRFGGQTRGTGGPGFNSPGVPGATTAGGTMGGGTMGGGMMGGNAMSSSLGRRGAQAGQTGATGNMTAEEQMVIMAAQKLHAQQSGDPVFNIMPPTPFDAEAGINPPGVPGQ